MTMQRPETDSATSRRIVVLSAPSGAGKTTIAHRLLGRNPGWRFSVSATTRPKRPNEVDGVDYHFLTEEEFRRKIEGGDLVEWEQIFGNFYGTLKSEVERVLAPYDGTRLIFDVDVKGALAIRDAFPADAYLIFVAPPTMEEMRRRLMMRQTESPEAVERRIARAEMEMAMRQYFDVIVVNDELECAVAEIEALLA
ncbi:MAG TPA: guanylate kinase [Candidatus Kapabacteria bacterium]|nr:guanylate kinase [Candidatus Kapabacteria bacterium]